MAVFEPMSVTNIDLCTFVRVILFQLLIICSNMVTQTNGFQRPANCDTLTDTDNWQQHAVNGGGHNHQSPSTPRTFLWSIDHPSTSRVSYLFGTIHVPYTRVWDYVAPSAKRAFEYAHSVYFELDLANRKTMKSLSRCQLLPDGDSIVNHVPDDVYMRLQKRWLFAVGAVQNTAAHFRIVCLKRWKVLLEANKKLEVTETVHPVIYTTDSVLQPLVSHKIIFAVDVSDMLHLRQMLPVWISGSEQKTMEQNPNRRKQRRHADYLFKNIAGNWERRRPIWLLLMINSLTPEHLRNHGVPVLDLFLARKAMKMQKHVGAVEDAQEQCEPLNSLENNQVLFVLNRTLLKFEQNWMNNDGDISMLKHQSVSDKRTDEIVHHYNCGSLNANIFNRDTTQVPRFPTDPIESDVHADRIDAYFRHELIDKRNIRMAQRVEQLLKHHSQHTLFFAFGAGHFLGTNSVIKLLQQAGYRVRPVIEDRSHMNHYATHVFPRPSFPNAHEDTSYAIAGLAQAGRPYHDLWKRIDIGTSSWDRLFSPEMQGDAPVANMDLDEQGAHTDQFQTGTSTESSTSRYNVYFVYHNRAETSTKGHNKMLLIILILFSVCNFVR